MYFDTNQKRHEDTREVAKDTFESLDIGKTTEIRDLPNQPEKFILTAKSGADRDTIVVPLGATLAVVGMLLTGWSPFCRNKPNVAAPAAQVVG